MRDPAAGNPVPKGREATHVTVAERTGMLGHLASGPKKRSALRLREPKRLPRALDRRETTDLLGSLRTYAGIAFTETDVISSAQCAQRRGT